MADVTFSGSQTDLVTYLKQWTARELDAAAKERVGRNRAYATGRAHGIQAVAEMLTRTTIIPERTAT